MKGRAESRPNPRNFNRTRHGGLPTLHNRLKKPAVVAVAVEEFLFLAVHLEGLQYPSAGCVPECVPERVLPADPTKASPVVRPLNTTSSANPTAGVQTLRIFSIEHRWSAATRLIQQHSNIPGSTGTLHPPRRRG
ncbi:uncharacterized protein PG998_001420 [Apiospora kogelbergensis]|uniref:Uncharacterized protein n=1 Tax=Apiospora kogelbergensis TaxID=1337665 RepID=A0AAW0QQJ2_9PEZI